MSAVCCVGVRVHAGGQGHVGVACVHVDRVHAGVGCGHGGLLAGGLLINHLAASLWGVSGHPAEQLVDNCVMVGRVRGGG